MKKIDNSFEIYISFLCNLVPQKGDEKKESLIYRTDQYESSYKVCPGKANSMPS